jgi:hypothetical protein
VQWTCNAHTAYAVKGAGAKVKRAWELVRSTGSNRSSGRGNETAEPLAHRSVQAAKADRSAVIPVEN